MLYHNINDIKDKYFNRTKWCVVQSGRWISEYYDVPHLESRMLIQYNNLTTAISQLKGIYERRTRV